MFNLTKSNLQKHNPTFALGVYVDDRPPADSWEPPQEPELAVVLFNAKGERVFLSEELESALIAALETHDSEVFNAVTDEYGYSRGVEIGPVQPVRRSLADVARKGKLPIE